MTESKKRFLNKILVFVPLGILLAVISFLFFDRPVAMRCMEYRPNGDFAKILVFAEIFGHGYGIVTACFMVYFLDIKSRIVIPRIVASIFATGAVVWVFKLSICRIRPHHFDFSQSIYHSFCGLGPQLHASELHSFPSGHTAAATALAIMLAWRYPQGRYLFTVLTFGVAFQRIFSGSHYLSDTIVGALIGFMVSGLFISTGPIPKLFDSLEKAVSGTK